MAGSSSEDQVFRHRARLFQMLAGGWAHQGTGDIRLLASPAALRVVMREASSGAVLLNVNVGPHFRIAAGELAGAPAVDDGRDTQSPRFGAFVRCWDVAPASAVSHARPRLAYESPYSATRPFCAPVVRACASQLKARRTTAAGPLHFE